MHQRRTLLRYCALRPAARNVAHYLHQIPYTIHFGNVDKRPLPAWPTLRQALDDHVADRPPRHVPDFGDARDRERGRWGELLLVEDLVSSADRGQKVVGWWRLGGVGDADGALTVDEDGAGEEGRIRRREVMGFCTTARVERLGDVRCDGEAVFRRRSRWEGVSLIPAYARAAQKCGDANGDDSEREK